MNAGERTRLILETHLAHKAILDACRPQHILHINGKHAGTYPTPSEALAALNRINPNRTQQWTITEDPGNLARLLTHQPGLTANHEPGTGEGDPTGNTADRPDQPAHDLRRLDLHLRGAYIALDSARRILANYGPPRPAGEADRLALERSNGRAEPHCEQHALITEPHSDIPLRIAPDPRRKGPTDAGGRLPEPKLLCRWCYGFVIDHGRLPEPPELEQHRDKGDNVRVRSGTTTRRPA